MSLYDDLGVSPDADADTIRAAHRRLVQQHHPDKGGNREDFDRVQRAYLILRDPVTRERYDRTGEEEAAPNNELAEIATLIIGCFDQATAQCGGRFDTVDLVKLMRDGLAQRKTNAHMSLGQLAEGIRTIDKVSKRLSFKGDGNDFLGTMLASRRRENLAAQEAVKAEIANIERAQAYAADYGYAHDPAPASGFADMYRNAQQASPIDWLNR